MLIIDSLPKSAKKYAFLNLKTIVVRDNSKRNTSVYYLSKQYREDREMAITFTELIIWLVIAAVIGFLGEAIARRRAPDGIVGAIIIGFLAIFIIVGLLHFHIVGEPIVEGVPLISSILVAVVLVVLWSGFAYRGYRRGYERYYRRGTYARRPRTRRRRWF
jgi:uncharacterized membrane protein YeaQ/YmgE (transglycosylase-associated protein family)